MSRPTYRDSRLVVKLGGCSGVEEDDRLAALRADEARRERRIRLASEGFRHRLRLLGAEREEHDLPRGAEHRQRHRHALDIGALHGDRAPVALPQHWVAREERRRVPVGADALECEAEADALEQAVVLPPPRPPPPLPPHAMPRPRAPPGAPPAGFA